jgi:hypothetical protein
MNTPFLQHHCIRVDPDGGKGKEEWKKQAGSDNNRPPQEGRVAKV